MLERTTLEELCYHKKVYRFWWWNARPFDKWCATSSFSHRDARCERVDGLPSKQKQVPSQPKEAPPATTRVGLKTVDAGIIHEWISNNESWVEYVEVSPSTIPLLSDEGKIWWNFVEVENQWQTRIEDVHMHSRSWALILVHQMYPGYDRWKCSTAEITVRGENWSTYVIGALDASSWDCHRSKWLCAM